MTQTQSNPSVLALVPAWNGEKFIAKTLESLAQQTYPNLRVLISDDASTDETVRICEEFIAGDDRFSLVCQPQNLGWLGNANALLQAADADYLLFAFHDDLLLPEYISRCVEALEANPEAIVAFSDMVTIYHQDGERLVGRCESFEGVRSRVQRGKLMLWQTEHWWAPNRGVFRSEAVRKIGGIRRNLAGEFSADWPWLLHMVLIGEVVRVPEVLVEKYYKDKSLSRGWNYSPRHKLAALLACAREIHLSPLTIRESLRLYATVFGLALRHLKRFNVREVRVKG